MDAVGFRDRRSSKQVVAGSNPAGVAKFLTICFFDRNCGSCHEVRRAAYVAFRFNASTK